MTVSTPANVSHAQRHATAKAVEREGADDASDLLDALQKYLSGEIEYQDLADEIAAFVNEHVDIPVLDEAAEAELIGHLVDGIETVLQDLAESGHLPQIATDLITGDLAVSDLDDRLTAWIQSEIDLPGPEPAEEAVINLLVRAARSVLVQYIRP